MSQFIKIKTFGVIIGFILIMASFVSSAIIEQAKSQANSDEKGKIQMNEKSKVIKGVDRLQWGKQQENTFIGALNVTMRALGEDVSYDYLMGVSGAAFRLHFCQPDWCPSSPDATCGFNHAEPALKALGYKAEFIGSNKDNPEEAKKVKDAIVKSIDKGFPVLGIDLVFLADWGVITGYNNNGEEFLCRTYYDKTDEYSKAEKYPWVVLIINEKGKSPEKKENALKSLEIAINIAETPNFDKYASGFNAYERWMADLSDDSRFENIDEQKLKDLTHTNGWCYNSLIDARESAVKYLRSVAGMFNKDSEKLLLESASIYEEELGKLKAGWKYAPMFWQLKGPKDWTKEMRHAQAEVLKESLDLEKKAIGKIKLAYGSEMSVQSDLDKKVVLNGLDKYQVIEPMFEGIRVILTYRGEKYSPAYIQGIAGSAFRIAGICPCAPTCSAAMDPKDLVKLMGYEVEYIPLNEKGVDPNVRVYDAIAKVKNEIRNNRPALVWHAFTNAEWDVVCGFDEEKKQFIGRGSYAGEKEYATADETRTIKCTDICDPLGVIIVGKKIGELDARKAEISALKAAVSHANTVKAEEPGKWTMLEGIQCYDRWVNDYKNPEKKRQNGDSYCYGVYRSTHRSASEFLKEIAGKYPKATAHLEYASKCFADEADVLDQCADLLWWNAPSDANAERNEKTSKLLAQARDKYVQGIAEIEDAIPLMEQ